MIPWPIALLTLFYAAVAFFSAASLWKVALGLSGQSIFWLSVWLILSAAAAAGLAYLKPWGRRFAMGTSWMLILSTLAVAALYIAASKPSIGLVITFTTACHYLMIRYLKRPAVVVWFGEVPKVKNGVPRAEAVERNPERVHG